ncbi:MAG: flagellar export protein FliJ, partial [Butyrivibrio sp.]|nr:flagellar export protein FliJ [Butyrivibrio sp.]
MARFRYKLQSILNIKLKMEDQAKQAFSVAKLRLDEEEEKLAHLQDRKRSYEDETRERLSGPLNVREIESSQNAILSMDNFIAD